MKPERAELERLREKAAELALHRPEKAVTILTAWIREPAGKKPQKPASSSPASPRRKAG